MVNWLKHSDYNTLYAVSKFVSAIQEKYIWIEVSSLKCYNEKQNKTKQNKKRVFFIRYSFLTSISFFLSSTGVRTRRNLTFPYFLNVTET